VFSYCVCVCRRFFQYQRTLGTFIRILNNETKEEIQLRFYKTATLPKTLLCGSEYQRSEAGDTYRTKSAEMGPFRTVQHCTTLDHTKNEERREYFKIKSVRNKTEIEEQKQNWLQ
jgi:hypothetical protein